MSAPLYIREPVVAGNPTTALVTGGSHATYAAIAWTEILPAVTEATLIESVTWSAHDFSTLAGQLLIALADGTGEEHVVHAEPIPIGSATLFASGAFDLNLTLPVGWRMLVAHDVQKGGGYVSFSINGHGGVVR